MQRTDAVTSWLQTPDVLELGASQADIWRIALDFSPASVKCLESILSAEERERANRFHFQKDKKRYIVAHACLRDILSGYLGCDPSRLQFSTNGYGKPALEGYHLEFNLSHSRDFALVAVTREIKIGVDVERIRPDLELVRMANHSFSQNEVDELTALPPEQQQTAFFNCWSRKEAYIKAQGLGLSLPLDSFDVSLDEPAILRATRHNLAEAARWTLLSLEVRPGYAAAAAVEGHGIEFRLWDF